MGGGRAADAPLAELMPSAAVAAQGGCAHHIHEGHILRAIRMGVGIGIGMRKGAARSRNMLRTAQDRRAGESAADGDGGGQRRTQLSSGETAKRQDGIPLLCCAGAEAAQPHVT